jgi:hypothetical protein
VRDMELDELRVRFPHFGVEFEKYLTHASDTKSGMLNLSVDATKLAL